MAKSCMVRSYKALSFRCGPDETRNLNDHYTSIYASLEIESHKCRRSVWITGRTCVD